MANRSEQSCDVADGGCRDGVRLFDVLETVGERWPIDVTLNRQIGAPGVTHPYFDVA